MKEVIKTENIARVYELGSVNVHALRSITMTVEKNEYVALIGPSGSGKSTLMNIIGCLDTPSSGNYWLRGSDVGVMEDNELAAIRNREIGFVFQTFNLIPRMSSLENVALPLVYGGRKKKERLERAREVLAEVGLEYRMDHKPNELSGGQKQRVAVARALVNDPSILLADEPTGNLDSKTTSELMQLFDQLHEKGNTIIIVTHEHDIAQHTRRIISLRDGNIETDLPDEVTETEKEPGRSPHK